jgi:hypothetical protein
MTFGVFQDKCDNVDKHRPRGKIMHYDSQKVDDAMLGLLYLATYPDGDQAFGFDWDTLQRLYQRGLIEKPAWKSRNQIQFTKTGLAAAERAFRELFDGDSHPIIRRQRQMREIVDIRERIRSQHGEMADSTELIREDRER